MSLIWPNAADCGLAVTRVQRATVATPRCEVEVEEEQEHDPAEQVHDVNRDAGSGEPAQVPEQHHIAADQQHNHAADHPGKEPLEHGSPEGLAGGSVQAAQARAQNHIGEEHATDPQDGGQSVKGEH